MTDNGVDGEAMHVLVIDNYDSFTYNLVQALASLGSRVSVRRNDAVEVEEALAMEPSHVVISPGPGRPEAAGISVALVAAAAPVLPVLGVCLGHQAIAIAFGGRLEQARSLMHGKASAVRHDGCGVFARLPNPLVAGRYHSLGVSDDGLPDELSVTARTEDGEIMGLRHRSLPLEGVQFHPESVLTPEGVMLLRNFLEFRQADREAG